MALVLTYTTLLSTIQSIIERGGATYDATTFAYIPTAINLIEQRIARELKIQGFIRVVDWVMQASVAGYQKPDRWRENVSMQIGTDQGTPAAAGNVWSPVYTRDYEFCRSYWPNSTLTDIPKYYADMDYTHWWFAPTPLAAFPVQTVYWELPPMLDAANQQNWTLEYAPNALLHGSVSEMFAYLKNDQGMATYAAMFDRDMAALSGEDIQKILDRMQKRSTS